MYKLCSESYYTFKYCYYLGIVNVKNGKPNPLYAPITIPIRKYIECSIYS